MNIHLRCNDDVVNSEFDITRKPIRNDPTEVLSNNVQKILKLDEINRRHIRHVLKIADKKINGKRGAADLLGVNPSTLRKRMKKLGIDYKRKKQKTNL